MNQQDGFEQVDTNAPFDALDDTLTKAMWALVGVAIGMFITAALIWFARYF